MKKQKQTKKTAVDHSGNNSIKIQGYVNFWTGSFL